MCAADFDMVTHIMCLSSLVLLLYDERYSKMVQDPISLTVLLTFHLISVSFFN